MKCPNCKEINLAITDRQGIEIDYCPQCRGVWLDRGELDRLIERAERPPPPPSARPPVRGDRDRDDDHYEHDGRYGKRRKSLLSELFDF